MIRFIKKIILPALAGLPGCAIAQGLPNLKKPGSVTADDNDIFGLITQWGLAIGELVILGLAALLIFGAAGIAINAMQAVRSGREDSSGIGGKMAWAAGLLIIGLALLIFGLFIFTSARGGGGATT